MNTKILALRVAGTIFGLVAVLHLLRVVTGVEVLIGGWTLPVWVNIMGCLGGGALCAWCWTEK